MEKWREIKGYEGLYEVSDLGHVRRKHYLRKLSLQDIEEAKRLRNTGMIYNDIATRFGVTQRAIIKALNVPAKRQPHRIPNRLLKPQNSHGYQTVTLCRDGKQKGIAVHILVMRAFVGDPGSNEINHINGDKFDPRLSNLEYISHQQNTRHARYVLKKDIGGDRRSDAYKAMSQNQKCVTCGKTMRFSGSNGVWNCQNPKCPQYIAPLKPKLPK